MDSAELRSKIETNPWLGVGLSAGACFAIGYLVGRGLSSKLPVARALRRNNDFFSDTSIDENRDKTRIVTYATSDRIADANMIQDPGGF